MRVPERTRLAAAAAAAKLRERAANLRPDEDLAVSIAANASAGDQFASAYAALRALGLEDRVLDGFGMENATASEMREAADLLEGLAAAERVPGRKKRRRGPAGKPPGPVLRWVSIVLAVIVGLPVVAVGGAFVISAVLATRTWWQARSTPAASIAPAAVVATPSPELRPVDMGYDRAEGGQIVPARPRDYVADRAGILGDARARALNGRLLQFERETSNQLVVFIDRTLPPNTSLEELGAASIRHWGVGQRGKDNGAILFVFLDDRKMRIEVGYGLEGVLTDARSKRITSEIIKPRFQQEHYAEGIEAGAQAIMDVTRGGDAALASAVGAAEIHGSIVPVIFFVLLAAFCFGLAWYVWRSVTAFLEGRGTFVFGGSGGTGGSSGGSWSSGSDSSSSDSSSSDSGGSFSGGGGDGGGGGASDSW